jgi:hypothetical protein
LGLRGGLAAAGLGLLSCGSHDCLPKQVCAPPLNTPYPDYYAMQQLTSLLTAPGSRLLNVTAGQARPTPTRTRRSCGRHLTLAPSSLTELVLRPARTW